MGRPRDSYVLGAESALAQEAEITPSGQVAGSFDEEKRIEDRKVTSVLLKE